MAEQVAQSNTRPDIKMLRLSEPTPEGYTRIRSLSTSKGAKYHTIRGFGKFALMKDYHYALPEKAAEILVARRLAVHVDEPAPKPKTAAEIRAAQKAQAAAAAAEKKRLAEELKAAEAAEKAQAADK